MEKKLGEDTRWVSLIDEIHLMLCRVDELLESVIRSSRAANSRAGDRQEPSGNCAAGAAEQSLRPWQPFECRVPYDGTPVSSRGSIRSRHAPALWPDRKLYAQYGTWGGKYVFVSRLG